MHIEVHDRYKYYEYCVIVTISGHRCGYVKTEEYDVVYGKDYDSSNQHVRCHGGLTYSDHTWFGGSDGYWIGFDCSHMGDAPDPEFKTEDNEGYYRLFNHGVVRTKDFCVSECKFIIDDIIVANLKIEGGLRIGDRSMF